MAGKPKSTRPEVRTRILSRESFVLITILVVLAIIALLLFIFGRGRMAR